MRREGRSMWAWAAMGVMVAIAMAPAGCETSPGVAKASLPGVYGAYERGDYETAYAAASELAKSKERERAAEASYMAGLSAQQLGDLPSAERYMRVAAGSNNRKLAGDALAQLGLICAQQDKQLEAAYAFEKAAVVASGEDKARAYFYAGTAWQKVGRWSQARSNFMSARSHSTDAAFRQRVAEQLAVTGFTLQIGFYQQASNAQQAAERIAQRATAQQLGYPRIIPVTDSAGRRGHLVQVGRFSSYSTAAMAKRALGESSAIIVPVRQ